eukprot:461442-Hanusia_phi.AAC.1
MTRTVSATTPSSSCTDAGSSDRIRPHDHGPECPAETRGGPQRLGSSRHQYQIAGQAEIGRSSERPRPRLSHTVRSSDSDRTVRRSRSGLSDLCHCAGRPSGRRPARTVRS